MILIVNMCSDVLSEREFVLPLAQIVGNCTIVRFDKVTADDIRHAKTIILSGTALKDFEYLNADFSWLLTCEKPVLGICAGMQVIARTFGAELVDSVRIGPQVVSIVKNNNLASGTFSAYFLHTKTASAGFEVLAQSEGDACLIKHPTKEIYGCIFHPEVMSQEIVKNFLRIP